MSFGSRALTKRMPACRPTGSHSEAVRQRVSVIVEETDVVGVAIGDWRAVGIETVRIDIHLATDEGARVRRLIGHRRPVDEAMPGYGDAVARDIVGLEILEVVLWVDRLVEGAHQLDV